MRYDSISEDLTPSGSNKFLHLAAAALLSFAFAAPAAAQLGDLSTYQGPGILSPGAGDVGQRGGQQVDLRYYGGVSGFYDSNPQAVSVDSNGNLIKAPSLYGVEVNFGAYGSHDFRSSKLSLDYRGDYRHATVANYDSSDHALILGYTIQASRRVIFDLRESVGTLNTGFGGVAVGATSQPTDALSASSLFFDTRTYYAESTAALTLIQSARTSYTISGSGFLRDYKSGGIGLANTFGYMFSGSVNHRLSKDVTLGAMYQRAHFESSGLGSQSTSNTYSATMGASLGRFWTFSVQAGTTGVSVESPFTLALSPLLAAILGQPTISGIVSSQHYYPSGSAELRRTFQRASLSFHYDRRINSGNGVVTTVRAQDAGIGIGYTGIRRLSLNFSGDYNESVSLDQGGARFRQYNFGAGGSFNLGRDLHLTGRYDYRDQEILNGAYSLRGSRSSVGIAFSPGRAPLSIW